jgi:hypothetical protein
MTFSTWPAFKSSEGLLAALLLLLLLLSVGHGGHTLGGLSCVAGLSGSVGLYLLLGLGCCSSLPVLVSQASVVTCTVRPAGNTSSRCTAAGSMPARMSMGEAQEEAGAAHSLCCSPSYSMPCRCKCCCLLVGTQLLAIRTYAGLCSLASQTWLGCTPLLAGKIRTPNPTPSLRHPCPAGPRW